MAVVSKKLMERYQELKQQQPETVLLMQVGAFMQVMNEDAKVVSKICGIKLQMAGDIDSPCVLGGFPRTGLDKYCGQLGKSIAIAPQDEAKERHINEVIRVDISQGSESNGLCRFDPDQIKPPIHQLN